MKQKQQQKPKIESIETYSAGRGKTTTIIKRTIYPKTRQFKHSQPHFIHARITSNPENIVLIEYLDTSGERNRKHVYLFPEGRELLYEEREQLALALLATLTNYKQLTVKGKTIKFPTFLSNSQYSTLREKYRRYNRWRKRNQ